MPSTGLIDRLLDDRRIVSDAFFGSECDRIVAVCGAMSQRFARGGRLLVLGSSPQERSDAQHVAVEFVHPVIVGKRALPALAVTGADGDVSAQVGLLARDADIVLVCGGESNSDVVGALDLARLRGCLTISCGAHPAEWRFDVPSTDPFIRQELVELLYHVLWEHVHVYLDQAPVETGVGAAANSSAAGFLYPFLDRQAVGADSQALPREIASSVLAKVVEAGELRHQTLSDNHEVLHEAADAVRSASDAGGTLFAFGNGGSATDAADLVADTRRPPGTGTPRPAIDLSVDGSILTALANDIGPASIFTRQLIALGRARDIAVAFSTSGDSVNILDALAEARRREMLTIAFVGYGGGRIASDALADHVIVTRSEYVPRIQEAQATAYHVLSLLIGR